MVSGPLATSGAGPWPSYQESFRARFRVKLGLANDIEHINGWKKDGVRERLDSFLDRGLDAYFTALTTKDERRIVHGDFNTSNILVDPDSGKINALIDYDFASVLHPSFEFLRSFDGAGDGFHRPHEDEEGQYPIWREAKLTGKFHLHYRQTPSPSTGSWPRNGKINCHVSTSSGRAISRGSRRLQTSTPYSTPCDPGK